MACAIILLHFVLAPIALVLFLIGVRIGRIKPGVCPSCGYAIHAKSSGTCSECGVNLQLVAEQRGQTGRIMKLTAIAAFAVIMFVDLLGIAAIILFSLRN